MNHLLSVKLVGYGIETSAPERFAQIYGLLCGCGRPAQFEVYEDRQPHCSICMLDAVDCEHQVLVRKIG